jgi:hypothetical protein
VQSTEKVTCKLLSVVIAVLEVSSTIFIDTISREALRRADPPSKESYRLCIGKETEKAVKVHKGCRGIIDR